MEMNDSANYYCGKFFDGHREKFVIHVYKHHVRMMAWDASVVPIDCVAKALNLSQACVRNIIKEHLEEELSRRPCSKNRCQKSENDSEAPENKNSYANLIRKFVKSGNEAVKNILMKAQLSRWRTLGSHIKYTRI